MIGGISESYLTEDLLAIHELDMVSIATPHAAHRDHLRAAVLAGKHVICEKPLAVSPADLDHMHASQDLATERGLMVACVFQHRFAALVPVLRHHLSEAGTFGAITSARLRFACTRSNAYYAKDAWRGTWSDEGGGLLINQAIHAVDIAIHLLGGGPTLVDVRVSRERMTTIEVEDRALGAVQLASGTVLEIDAINDGESGWDHQIEITTALGSVVYTTNGNGTLIDCQHQDSAVVAELQAVAAEATTAAALPGKDCYGDLHQVQFADAIQAALTNQAPLVDIHTGAVANAVVLACYHATATGAPSPVPPPSDTYQQPDLGPVSVTESV